MKRFLIGLGVLLVVLVAAAWFVPPLLPADTYRGEIESRFQAATGRTLSIKGDMSFRLLPSIAVTAEDVDISNIEGAPSDAMARLKRLDVQLQLFPLLSGETRIDRFVLVEPVINLETGTAGRPNWEFTPPVTTEGKPVTPATPPATPPTERAGSSAGTLAGLRIADVRIENGTLNYRAGASPLSLQKINLTVAGGDVAAPLTVKGSTEIDGRTLSVDARIETLASLMSGGAAKLALSVNADRATLKFEGRTETGAAIKGSGTLSADVPSVGGLAEWLTGQKPTGGVPDRIAFSSPVAFTDNSLTLSEFKLTADKIEAAGRLAVALGAVPTISGKITASELDLRPYTGGSAARGGAGTGGGTGAGPGGGSGGGAAGSSGWSTDPIDVSALRLVNMDLELDLKDIRTGQAEVDRAAVRLRLDKGALTATIADLRLYGGQGSGTLRLAATGRGVEIAPKLTLKDVDGYRVLRAFAGTERLEGKGTMSVDVTGAGRNQQELVSSLAGKIDFRFVDGAVRGINIAAMLRNISPGALREGFDDAQKTDFAELAGSFAGKGGTFTTSDLRMQSPLLRLTGAGSVFVPSQSLDLLLQPRLVGTIEGQGTEFDRAGVTIPVRVKGPWDKPSFRPDLSGAIKDKLKDGIKVPDNLKESVPDVKERGRDLLRRLPGQR